MFQKAFLSDDLRMRRLRKRVWLLATVSVSCPFCENPTSAHVIHLLCVPSTGAVERMQQHAATPCNYANLMTVFAGDDDREFVYAAIPSPARMILTWIHCRE